MIYTLTCKQCKAALPRVEFRKRGGGVHKLCPQCRQKEYAERTRIKNKVQYAKKKIEKQRQEQMIEAKTRELQTEFNRITRNNRTRIRILKENQNPTKATIRSLAYREKQQMAWDTALEHMLTEVREGKQMDTDLSQYYRDTVCSDTL